MQAQARQIAHEVAMFLTKNQKETTYGPTPNKSPLITAVPSHSLDLRVRCQWAYHPTPTNFMGPPSNLNRNGLEPKGYGNCKESLQRIMARTHCKELLPQRVIRIAASCKEPSTWSQVQVTNTSCKYKAPNAWSQVRVKIICKLQEQVASAKNQMQVASVWCKLCKLQVERVNARSSLVFLRSAG